MKNEPPARQLGEVRTILLVDDLDQLRAVFHRALVRQANIRVLEAGDSISARAVLLSENVNVIVCDLNMPGMRGDKFLAEVGQRWPQVRRVLLTAWSTADLVIGSDYEVLDKQLKLWFIVDTIVKLARMS